MAEKSIRTEVGGDMAKTQLTLKLSYKGKLLDVVKANSHFKKTWLIGSNKHLLWQILEPSFPEKHILVSQQGGEWVMHLLPGADVDCSQNGKPAEASALKSSGLLKGNNLTLRTDMAGKVKLNPDWVVSFEFNEPWVHILTEEERQIVAQYSRRGEITPTEKFNRGMVMFFTILTVIFLFAYEFFLKPPTVAADTVEAKLAQMQAQRVQIPQQVQQRTTGESDAEARARAAAAKAAAEAAARAAAEAAAREAANAGRQQGTQGGTPGGQGSASAVFGNFTPGAVRRSDVVAATTTRTFVAASRDGGPGGGPGSGPGGPGTGPGGQGSTFDPGAIGSYNQSEISSAVTNRPGIQGSSTRPSGENISVASGGDLSKLAPRGRPIAQTAADQSAIRTFQSENVEVMTSESITAAPAETRPDLQTIASQVNSRKGQVENLYRRAAAIKATSGSVKIRLYIDNRGNVVTAIVTPTTEGFTEQFLQDLKSLVEGWSFNISSKQVYEFTYRLSN